MWGNSAPVHKSREGRAGYLEHLIVSGWFWILVLQSLEMLTGEEREMVD